jgi:hypothetical protein
MDVGINNVVYMELHSGPKMANGTCGKTIVVGTIDRGSTVYEKYVNNKEIDITVWKLNKHAVQYRAKQAAQ